MVGVSGSSGQRASLVTASAFSLPALKCASRLDFGEDHVDVAADHVSDCGGAPL